MPGIVAGHERIVILVSAHEQIAMVAIETSFGMPLACVERCRRPSIATPFTVVNADDNNMSVGRRVDVARLTDGDLDAADAVLRSALRRFRQRSAQIPRQRLRSRPVPRSAGCSTQG